MLVPLGGMVEDDVEIDLDSGAVERFDHFLEFANLRARRLIPGVSPMRRIERDRVVTPVIRSLRDRSIGGVARKFMNRHEFDRRDPERFEIGNLLDESQIGSRFGDSARRGLRKAANMEFVNDLVGEIATNAWRVAPVEFVVDDNALRRMADAVYLWQEVAGKRASIWVDE